MEGAARRLEDTTKNLACIPGGRKLIPKIIIIFLISIVCFCISPIHAGAENWTYFDSDNSGKWYYDKENLTGTRTGIVVFWAKVIYTKEALRELIDEEKKKGTYKKKIKSSFSCNPKLKSIA